VKGHRVILLRSMWTGESHAGILPGTICDVGPDRLTVAAGSGALHLLAVQPEGRRPMAIREFLSGHHLSPGDHFEPR
jgi:methionyl-tRNA formyltransferase